MPKLALSDLKLRSLPTPQKGQLDYWDNTLPGFGVRVSQGGSKTFVLNIDNARRSIGRFGIISLAEARAEAKRILAERTLGRVRPQFMTFIQARDEFLAEKQATRRASTYAGLKRFLHLYFPFKGALTEATHGEIVRRLNKITAPSEKSHATAAAKVFFTWCVKKRYLTDNPTMGLSTIPGTARFRVLSDDELKYIWEASNDLDLPEHFRTIVKLLILTGQRRGEIAALRAEYCDLRGKKSPSKDLGVADGTNHADASKGASTLLPSQCTITLPSTLTKNGREHTFPIGELASLLLQSRLSDVSLALLFPARGTRSVPFNGWSKSKALLDEISGVTDWTLHDLRRTYATNLAKLGTPIHVVEKLLNHISGTTGGLVAVYQRHQYWDEQVIAVTAWNDRLQQILKG